MLYRKFAGGNYKANKVPKSKPKSYSAKSMKAQSSLIRCSWTTQEDNLLRTLVKKYGVMKWSTISKKFVGRNSKQCYQRSVRVVTLLLWTPYLKNLYLMAVSGGSMS